MVQKKMKVDKEERLCLNYDVFEGIDQVDS